MERYQVPSGKFSIKSTSHDLADNQLNLLKSLTPEQQPRPLSGNQSPPPTANLEVIQKTAKLCDKLLQQLIDLTKQLSDDDFFCDCTRLIDRASIFRSFITKIIDKDNNVITIVTIPKKANELQFLLETLELIKSFIINHKDRISFYGITETSTRNLYTNDIAKLNQRIIRLSEGFNLIETSKESSFIQRRKEDLKDAKTSFKAATLRVLDEITNVKEDPRYYIFHEEEFKQLVFDVNNFNEGLSLYLSLMKHHPLSVYEARALKMELKKLTTTIEIRKDEYYKVCEKKKAALPSPTSLPAPGLTINMPPNESTYSANYSALTSLVDDPNTLLSSNQIYTKHNQQNKILEQYRLSPADIRRTKIMLDYGNFGQISLGIYKDQWKITVRKLTKKESNTQYLAERLLLMHHLATSSTGVTSTNNGAGGIVATTSPFIQQFYGFISSEHSYQIVEEYTCNGLFDMILNDINQFPFFQINLRIAWILDILSGIAFLHSKGIIHSEITPGNILISDRLKLKLGNIHSTSDILHRYSNEPKKLYDIYEVLYNSPYIAPEIKDMIQNIRSTNSNGDNSPPPSTITELMNNKLEFTIENDIYSFMITCFVIIFRKVPTVEDDYTLQEQFNDSLNNINFHSEDAKTQFNTFMLSMMEYKPLPNPITPHIVLVDRPKSDVLLPQVNSILRELGDDPRIIEEEESHEMYGAMACHDTYLAELEQAVLKLQNSRIGKTGFSELLKKTAFLKSTSNESAAVQHHTIPVPPPPSRQNDGGITTRRPNSYRGSGSRPTSLNRNTNNFATISHSTSAERIDKLSIVNPSASTEAYLRAENITQLKQFLREDAHCTSKHAAEYAEILVNKGIPTVTVLTRRLERDHNLLIKFGFDVNDVIEILEAVSRVSKMQTMMKNSTTSSLHKADDEDDVLAFLSANRLSKTVWEIPRLLLPTDIANTYERATLQNDEESHRQLETIADSGDQFARGFLMRMYALGQGGKKADFLIARKLGEGLFAWLEVIIQQGFGIPNKDYHKAFQYYLLSAKQGYSKAEYRIGILLEEELIHINDEEIQEIKLHEFPNLVTTTTTPSKNTSPTAKRQGFQEKKRSFNVSTDHSDTSQDDFDHQQQRQSQQRLPQSNNMNSNAQEAFYWYLSSATKGLPDSQVKVGNYYEYGVGTVKDAKKAFQYYELAGIEGNNTVGKYHLGYCYSTGTGVAPDIEKALFYYHESAKEGNVAAQNNLAYMYYKGYGIEKNIQEAIKWYQKSVEKGYAPAMFNLASLYEKYHNNTNNGKGVVIGGGSSVKIQEIINLYLAAAKGGVQRAKVALNRLKS
eukprot:gene12396-13551_t